MVRLHNKSCCQPLELVVDSPSPPSPTLTKDQSKNVPSDLCSVYTSSSSSTDANTRVQSPSAESTTSLLQMINTMSVDDKVALQRHALAKLDSIERSIGESRSRGISRTASSSSSAGGGNALSSSTSTSSGRPASRRGKIQRSKSGDGVRRGNSLRNMMTSLQRSQSGDGTLERSTSGTSSLRKMREAYRASSVTASLED